MIVYNLFPLLAGHFSAWKSHIDRAADMGFDWIFVNPVQKPGESESLYSIADYFQLNSRLADPQSPRTPEEQLREVIQYAEQRGLRMMVDLVINHCASDSPLAHEHPEWFIRDPDGDIAHPCCLEDGEQVVWDDLIQFDHGHTTDPEGLYQYCRAVVEYLSWLGFRGFRCDAAYQIPDFVWRRLIHETKSLQPHVVFAAETLGCTEEETRCTAGAGFDFIFNSSKWWDFQADWLMQQHREGRAIAPSISFPESHDTERLLEESDGNVNVVKQRYLFAAMFSAGVMMPIGFEHGLRQRLHVVDTQPDDWRPNGVDLRDFIRQVNHLKRQYPVLHEETVNTLLPSANPNVLVMRKTSPRAGQEALLILNKDPENWQYFEAEDLQQLVENDRPLVDVSPEYSTGRPPQPFRYDLNPGQGLVMVTAR